MKELENRISAESLSVALGKHNSLASTNFRLIAAEQKAGQHHTTHSFHELVAVGSAEGCVAGSSFAGLAGDYTPGEPHPLLHSDLDLHNLNWLHCYQADTGHNGQMVPEEVDFGYEDSGVCGHRYGKAAVQWKGHCNHCKGQHKTGILHLHRQNLAWAP